MPQAVVSDSLALDMLCVNAVRTLSIDMVQQANSGHPGAPMGLAPIGYVLWAKHLRHNPKNPKWVGRDRFVLSGGHASAFLYSLLHLSGYDLTLDDLKAFRQRNSLTPGHPEYNHPPGTETTTGPLGQGIGNAVGMAIAQSYMAAEFSKPGHTAFDHHTYFIAGDGDLMEGISHEVCSMAGTLKLSNLIGIFDDNRITIDGPTSLSAHDDTAKRFESYGWEVFHVSDGNDLALIDGAIEAAKKSDKPSLIIARTHIGYGSPNKQDSSAAHGAPLGEEEIKLTKENLGWEYSEPFTVPDEVRNEWASVSERGKAAETEWQKAFDAYAAEYPELAKEFNRRMAGELPAGWEKSLPDLSGEKAMATRKASGKVLNAIAGTLPELVGGSADLAGSNLTTIAGSEPMAADNPGGRTMFYGVREHGMGAIMNGMALHGGFLPYGGTFLVFSDYMRPPIRLAAMMGLDTIYVFTHDSIGLGEDGPTHQPIEMMATLRTIPNLTVIRPADAVETAEAWGEAVDRKGGPVILALTRQGLPPIDRSKLDPNKTGVRLGAYVAADADDGKPEAIVIATGSEVQLALEAKKELDAAGTPTRVVSMPCVELFAEQSKEYRDEVLPPEVTVRVAVEAAHPMPWHRWVGGTGRIIGLTHFGASAPYETLFSDFGITTEAVVKAVREQL